MRVITLVFVIVNSYELVHQKLRLIKLIRNMTDLGLKEAKDFVEQVFFPGGGVFAGEEIKIKFTMTQKGMDALLELTNDDGCFKGLKLRMFEAQKIYDLRLPPRPPLLVKKTKSVSMGDLDKPYADDNY